MSLFQKPDIGIDLGTSKFSLHVQGQGLIAQESSLVAYYGPRLTASSVVAIGRVAQSMEKSGAGITVMSPMRDGVIVDAAAAQILLATMAHRAGLRWSLHKPKTLVTSLLGATALERRTFSEVAGSLGSRKTLLRDEPLAAANALSIDLSEPFANLVLDVGEGASEVIVVNAGRMMCGQSLRAGGAQMDRALVAFVKQSFDLTIPLQQAKELKESLALKRDQATFALRGTDRASLLPKRLFCSRAALQGVLDETIADIVQMICDTLRELPAGSYVELLENGLYLCGGAARTSGLKQRLEEATGFRVHMMEEPENAVIRGCGLLLPYIDYLGA